MKEAVERKARKIAAVIDHLFAVRRHQNPNTRDETSAVRPSTQCGCGATVWFIESDHLDPSSLATRLSRGSLAAQGLCRDDNIKRHLL